MTDYDETYVDSITLADDLTILAALDIKEIVDTVDLTGKLTYEVGTSEGGTITYPYFFSCPECGYRWYNKEKGSMCPMCGSCGRR